MIFNSDQLMAFLAVCRSRNISRASRELGLTQAALSIRIKKLEDTIERTLFIRSKSGVTLTDAGLKVLTFAETLEGMEKECLGDLNSADKGALSGAVRIGCFSTIGRSFVLPAIQGLLQKHPVDLHFQIRELSQLPALLQSGEADFIFLDHELKREGVKSVLLGHERYVFIKGQQDCEEIFLNHDADDMISYRYFEMLGKKNVQLKRRFVDEIYSVLDGVEAGIGVSVVPEHLVKKNPRIKVVNPSKALLSPVYLCYKEAPYKTRLFHSVLKALQNIHL